MASEHRDADAPHRTPLDRTARTIRLRDGRTLAFAEYGAADGVPVLYFTGSNSSRLEGAWFDDEAAARGIRLIATDRPGMGRSDFQPDRTLLDWPDDVEQLADALGIADFAVLAMSFGGPHAAAVAHRMPDRLTAVAIASGPSPYGTFEGMWAPGRIVFFLARRMPLWFNVRIQRLLNDPDNLIKNRERLPSPDATLLSERPEVAELFRLSQIESMRSGTEGAAHEARMYTRPWGFDLSAIGVPIALWYGESDVMVPPAMGRSLHHDLPNSTLRLLTDEAHFSLINNHIGEILDGLVPQLGASTPAA